MHAHEMHACEVLAYKVLTREAHAHETHAHQIHARRIHAHKTPAHQIHARGTGGYMPVRCVLIFENRVAVLDAEPGLAVMSGSAAVIHL
jgi:hypothetical protein